MDAVVVCSWGPTHEEYVLAAIEAGKPVFCEKPLATTQEACQRILDAESALGRRSVQVGYMRRYDAAYRAMKAVVDSGDIGAPLMMHAAHRNPSVPGHYTREMAITDTAVHDIDLARWMFGEEIVAATVLKPRKNSNGGDLRGSAAADLRDGRRCAGRRRDQREHPLRLRHPRRGGRRDRHRRPGRVQPGHRPERTTRVPAGFPRTGASGSSPPTTPSSRSGSTASATAAPTGRARGTATPPPRCPMPPSRRCTPVRRMPVDARREAGAVRLDSSAGDRPDRGPASVGTGRGCPPHRPDPTGDRPSRHQTRSGDADPTHEEYRW